MMVCPEQIALSAPKSSIKLCLLVITIVSRLVPQILLTATEYEPGVTTLMI